MQFHQNNQRGVTLLLSVLFLTAGLSISLGIFYIVLVQLQINRAARESHKALYSANTAKECVAYYRNYIGGYDDSNYGFWDVAHPCGSPDADGDFCDDPDKIPVCRDAQVLKTSLLPGAKVPGIDYNFLPDTQLPLSPDSEGLDHVFTFSIRENDTCADAVITTRRRVVGGVPVTRLITVVNGLSSCDDPKAVNRSFQECIATDGDDTCQ